MGFAINVTSAPSSEPITLAEAKTHLRVDTSDDDTYIASLIQLAREVAEKDLRRALFTQTIQLKLDEFPDTDYLLLPFAAPLQSVSSVSYNDVNGDAQTFATSNYTVDTSYTPGRILLEPSASFPITEDMPSAVTITYVAGYTSTDDIPERIKHAIKLLVGNWYCSRVPVSPQSMHIVPMSYEMLIQPWALSTP